MNSPAEASDGKKSRASIALALIFLVGCWLRISAVYSHLDTFRAGLGRFGDSLVYHCLGYHLAVDHVYSSTRNGPSLGMIGPPEELIPSVTRAPTYPLFLAIVYKLHQIPTQTEQWTPIWTHVRVIQCVMDAAVCLLVFLMTRRLNRTSYKPALLAATLYSLNPYTTYFARAILAEPLATFCLAASLYCLLRQLQDESSVIPGLLAGAGLALASMARPENHVLAAIFALQLGLRLPRKHGLRQAGLFLLSFFLSLAPWALRTSLILGKFTLTPVGQQGYSLYHGSYETPWNWIDWDVYPDSLQLRPDQLANLNLTTTNWLDAFHSGRPEVVAHDQIFMDMAMDRYKTTPVECVKTWFARVPLLWRLVSVKFYYEPEPPGYYMWTLLVLAAIGTLTARGPGATLLASHPVSITLILLPLHVEPRFSILAIPALSSLAGLGLARLIRRRTEKIEETWALNSASLTPAERCEESGWVAEIDTQAER